MKTYKFKLYTTKNTKHLDDSINIACEIYNFALTYKKQQYNSNKISVSKNDLQKLLANMRNSTQHSHWNKVGAQVIQQITDRIYNGYNLFFKTCGEKVKAKKLPSLKKTFKYKSITYKQVGYKLLESNRIRINNIVFKYHKSREIEGKIKTLTVKRNKLGEYFILITTDHVGISNNITIRSGKIVGFDFGLKQFLTGSDGNDFISPMFFKQNKKIINKLNRDLSSKKKLSNNRVKARVKLAKVHEDIANKRDNFHWQLANTLIKQYDMIFLETLDMRNMKSRFGRKVSDLGFYSFVQKLQYVADKHNKRVVKINKWFPSSKTCSCCGYVNKELQLRDRRWVCKVCNIEHDRDFNAAVNILAEGSRVVGTSTIKTSIIRPDLSGK